MKKVLFGLLVLILALAFIIPGAAVYAAPPNPPAGSFVNAGGVPAGSVLVLNINMKITNDEDSGNVGYWALDNYNKAVQVWQVPDGSFYAVARYTGKYQTFDGAMSPGLGVPITQDAQGTFEGGYTATFNATGCTGAFGYIGSFDFGGTKADILLGTYGKGQTGPATPSSWLATYFTGVSGFNQPNWGWTYKYKNQRWNNFSTGTTGDIVP